MSELHTYLKIMGDKTRFNIIKILLNGEMCVGALARHLGISEAAVSQHLQILRKAGILRAEKRGYWTHYSVQRDIIKRLAEELNSLAEISKGDTLCPRKSKEKYCCYRKR